MKVISLNIIQENFQYGENSNNQPPKRELLAWRTSLDVDPIFGHLSIALPRAVHSRNSPRVYKPTGSFTGRGTAFIFLGHEVIGAVRNTNLHRWSFDLWETQFLGSSHEISTSLNETRVGHTIENMDSSR